MISSRIETAGTLVLEKDRYELSPRLMELREKGEVIAFIYGHYVRCKKMRYFEDSLLKPILEKHRKEKQKEAKKSSTHKKKEIPDYIKEEMNKAGVKWREVTRLEDAMSELDILYMTRVQRERFFNEADYIRLKDSYILNLDKLKTAKEDLAILHPLPRVNEISVEVDDDPRACYFFQALCGKHIRMALILFLLGIK